MVKDVVGSVLRDEPDWSLFPAELARLVERCLRKNPREWLRDIGDARFLLEEGHEEPVSPMPSLGRGPWRAATLGVLAGLIAGSALALALLRSGDAPSSRRLRHLSVSLPSGAALPGLSGLNQSSIALSPDGEQLVYAGSSADGQEKLYLRPLGSPQTSSTRRARRSPSSRRTDSGSATWIAPTGSRKCPFGEGPRSCSPK